MGTRKRILFITTGTSTGKERGNNESLSNGIYSSVSFMNPDKSIYFGTADSKKTFDLILELYDKDGRSSDGSVEFVELQNPDIFMDCYKKMVDKMQEYSSVDDDQRNEIIINYTSGTKTMTMAAAILGLLYNKKLILVGGTRVNGLVAQGMESIQEQNLYLAYDFVKLERAIRLFNSYEYIRAKEEFESIESLKSKESVKIFLIKLCNIFDSWDKFDRDAAHKELESINRTMDSDGLLDNLKAFLKIPLKANCNGCTVQNPNEFKLIIELLQNAGRRIDEEKYDDAVARPYRTSELIGQTILRECYGLDSSDIDVNKIKELLKERQDVAEFIKGYEKEHEAAMKTQEKIKIGLFKVYELISRLKGEAQSLLESNKRFRNLIQMRNESILAHGMKPIEKAASLDLFESVKKIAEQVWNSYSLSPSFSDCMNKAKFPELNHKAMISRVFS